MILIVTGSREASESEALDAIRSFAESRWPDEVWHGGCSTGADFAAGEWRRSISDTPPRVFVAEWDAHGPAAGPIRNQAMIAAGYEAAKAEDVYVLAIFARGAGNRGTKDCVKRAIEAGLPVDIRHVRKVIKHRKSEGVQDDQ